MDIVKVKVDDITIYAPRYPLLFLRQVPHARYIECNHTRTKQFHTKFGQDTTPDALAFRKSARNLLMKAKKTLDELEIRFWMSSGTCLGEWVAQMRLFRYYCWAGFCLISNLMTLIDLGLNFKSMSFRMQSGHCTARPSRPVSFS